MKRFIIFFIVAMAFCGCMKDVSFRTNFILNPYVELESGAEKMPLDGVLLYAFKADTTEWRVNSYDDAAFGVITNKESGEQKGAAAVGAQSPTNSPDKITVEMATDFEQAMLVAVDTENRCYAYTNYKVGVNLPQTYMTLMFRPWKNSASFKDGKWMMMPTIYSTRYLVNSFAELSQGGGVDELDGALAYLFDADTTAWYVANYENAIKGVVTHKSSGEEKKAAFTGKTVEGKANQVEMQSNLKSGMVVVVDELNGWYGYANQTFDYNTAEISRDIIFRDWSYPESYDEDGWRVKPAIYNTSLLIDCYVQSADTVKMIPYNGAKAFAIEADTTAWGVASLEDALIGRVTNKESGEQMEATVLSTMKIDSDTLAQMELKIDFKDAMILLVDEQSGAYAYTEQEVNTFTSEVAAEFNFETWKNSAAYKSGRWSVYPTIVTPEEEVEE